MRHDGRRADEIRPVNMTPDYTIFAEGSVLIEVGNTRVLCNATIENGVPRWMQAQGKAGGWITGEYAMLPRATQYRTQREIFRPAGRTQEIRRLIGRSLRAAFALDKLGSRTCIVDCDVVQADGGTRTASITGGYVALALALRKLIQDGEVEPAVLRPPVAAVSVGILEHEPLLDLCYEEDHRAEVDANIVMNANGEFIEIQITAESRPFSKSMLDNLILLAQKGISQLLSEQQSILEVAGNNT